MDDHSLLERWIHDRDAQAFQALADRHAGLIYGTCRRIIGDHQAAEDLAQEVLLELARSAAAVRGSVAGFVHAVARSRALNRLRDEGTRRRHEVAAGGHAADSAQVASANEPAWAELAPRLDVALAELSDELRLPLVLHYLQGRTQAEVGRELGCDPTTVSRRIARSLGALRERLGSAGLAVAVVTLTGHLSAHAAEGAPAAVIAAAGRISLTAAAAPAAKAAAAGLLWVSIGTPVVLMVAATIAFCTLWPPPADLNPRPREPAVPPSAQAPPIVPTLAESEPMPAHPSVQMTTLTPLLFVRDLERSLACYVDRVGFSVAGEWTSAPGDNRWRKLSLGDVGLMLRQMPTSGPDARIPSAHPGEGISFYVMCTDAIAIYHELTARGSALERPSVANGYWVTGCTDPDGFSVHFESPTDQPEGSVYEPPAKPPAPGAPAAAQRAILVPLLDVTDIQRSLAYYVDGLGFTVINQWTSPAGDSHWRHLRQGATEVMLGQAPATHRQPTRRGQDVSLVIACTDAIAFYHSAVARGLIMNRPFVSNGSWVVGAQDPDSFDLSFQSPADAQEGTVLQLAADPTQVVPTIPAAPTTSPIAHAAPAADLPPPFIAAILPVADLPAARRFWVERMGFTCPFEWGGYYAVLYQGEAILHLTTGTAWAPGAVELRCDDVDAWHARLTAAGVPVERAPKSEASGRRTFALRDADGNRVALSSPARAAGAATSTTPKVLDLMPILPVSDLPRAVAFYRGVFGFGHTAAQADAVDIAVGAHTLRLERVAGPVPGRHVYIEVADVDRTYDQARRQGATIADPIADRDYGMRDFAVLDPDGHRLAVGSPLQPHK